MKIMIILGNIAVGKMTVGQELAKITDLKLFHNHIVLEPVIEVFGFNFKIAMRLREVIYEEFAASENYGLIVTLMFDFSKNSVPDLLDYHKKFFDSSRTDFYIAELVAPQEVRLQRNVTENRLRHKASMRNTEASSQRIIDGDKNSRCVSYDGEVTFENYIKIDNTNLAPDVVAKMIKDKFIL